MQAALLVGTRRPLVVEEVELDPPKAGEVHVKVAASGTKRYPLAEINEAHRALAAGENARGLIVF